MAQGSDRPRRPRSAVFFAVVFHERYWQWCNCFNELGRCWNNASEQVYLEQSGMYLGGGTNLFMIPALLILWRAARP